MLGAMINYLPFTVKPHHTAPCPALCLKMALSYVKAVLVLAASLSGSSRDLLATYGGQTQPASLEIWIGHGAYNNDRCWVNTGQSYRNPNPEMKNVN